MSEAPHQPHRRDRLQALLDHADFGGNKSELARALGFSSGAFVHQMLKGIRPVLEKTILKAHTMKAGKYRGWFDQPVAQPMLATVPELTGTPAYLAELAAKLSPEKQERLVAVAELLAGPQGDRIRFSFALAERAETPTPGRARQP